MGMKFIIDSDAVIQRMSLKDIQEVADAVDSSLTTAHALLQGILDTVFEPTTNVNATPVVQTPRKEIFYLDDSLYPRNINTLMTCKTKQAFIWSGSVVVEINENGRRELIDPAMPNTTLTEDVDYVVDYVKGYVRLDEEYSTDWVRITYNAGFDKDHPSPDWLKEAVMGYMPMMLSQPEGGINLQTMRAMLEVHKTVQEEVAKICEPYLRNRSFQFNPII